MKIDFPVNLSTCALASLALVRLDQSCLAQEETRESLAGEEAAQATARAAIPARYNLRWGAGGLTVGAGLRGEYVDNVFLTDTDTRDDFILVPQVDVGAFFPVGQLNTIGLQVGIAYYHYFKNDDLNTQVPLINPNSEIAFNFYTGDFAFRLSESFSYQESPFYEIGAPFYNVYSTGQFARFHNRVGLSMAWNLQDAVVTAGYHHVNMWARETVYDYVDRASEVVDAKALFTVAPETRAGLEAEASFNDYANVPWNTNWRARVGPAFEWKPSRFLGLRGGGGYERIQYEPEWHDYLGLSGLDTYYFYVDLEHEINRFISHRLNVSHDNENGINAANLEGTHVRYSLRWRVQKALTVSPYAGIHFYDESYGPSAQTTPYEESFSYVDAGIAIDRELGPHWRAGLSWNYRLKDSDLEGLGYAQNVARLEIRYQF